MNVRCNIPAVLAVVFALTGVPSLAQDIGVQRSPILVIDSDRVFKASRAGQQITAQLEDQLAALSAENRKIEAQLEAEELSLTERRSGMNPVEFRQLADAFDEKVQGIRAAQDAKQREMQRLREAENKAFIDAIAPVLSGIGRERGALIVLERRSVLLSADTIDITEEAIARINAAGQPDAPVPENSQTPNPDANPDPVPDPGSD